MRWDYCFQGDEQCLCASEKLSLLTAQNVLGLIALMNNSQLCPSPSHSTLSGITLIDWQRRKHLHCNSADSWSHAFCWELIYQRTVTGRGTMSVFRVSMDVMHRFKRRGNLNKCLYANWNASATWLLTGDAESLIFWKSHSWSMASGACSFGYNTHHMNDDATCST